MTGQVAGKVALVTGGASGIGAAVAELLAREGASVAVTDVDDLGGPEIVAGIKKPAARRSSCLRTSPARRAGSKSWPRSRSAIGRLDILVSNAGIGIAVPSIADMSLEDWRRQTAINLDGVFLSVKHCLPADAQDRRRLDHHDVVAGGPARRARPVRLLRHQGRRPAVRQGDRDGVRLGRRRHPGQLGASRHHRHADLGQDSDGSGRAADRTRRSIRKSAPKLATPLGRAGQAAEIASGVLYLASDASSYVTGTELVIDGGMNAGGVARRPADLLAMTVRTNRPAATAPAPSARHSRPPATAPSWPDNP